MGLYVFYCGYFWRSGFFIFGFVYNSRHFGKEKSIHIYRECVRLASIDESVVFRALIHELGRHYTYATTSHESETQMAYMLQGVVRCRSRLIK